MNRDKVEELIAKYIDESELGKQTAELRAQIAELETRQGLLDLVQVEERVEALVKRHGLSYEGAFNLAVSELEEKELAHRARLKEVRAEKTITELNEMSPEQEMRILEQEEEGEA